MVEMITLTAARELIADNLSITEGETVSVKEALARIPVQDGLAKVALPGCDQSMRDGFALGLDGEVVGQGRLFRLVGEIPAGSREIRAVAVGAACRIMTGAMVPAGTVRVVPQEDCLAEGATVTVPLQALARKNPFLEKRGSQIGAGECVAKAGTILLPEHLALLVATGHGWIEVFRRPRVGYFCTGSELVESLDQLELGLKISANRYLLDGLVRQFLAEPEDLGIIRDAQAELDRIFERLDAASLDVVISTGGMGPGKYDLLAEAFCRAGGKVLFRSLGLRPGHGTLCGKLGNMLFFGLPGPPGAVRTLMNELVGPALLQLQGARDYSPVAVQARLAQRIEMRDADVLQIKAGMLSCQDGQISARLAGRQEAATCFLLFPPGGAIYESGSLIQAHMAYSPCASALFSAS